MNLNKSIKMLTMHRRRLADLADLKAQAYQAMLEAPQGLVWQELGGESALTEKAAKKLAASIRRHAAAVYERATRLFGPGQCKKRWFGITIKEYTVVRVAPGADLVAWAEDNAPVLVVKSIDMKVFNQLVKAGKVPAIVAQVVKEPRASIAKNLEGVCQSIEVESENPEQYHAAVKAEVLRRRGYVWEGKCDLCGALYLFGNDGEPIICRVPNCGGLVRRRKAVAQ